MIDGDLRKLFRDNIKPFHWVTIESGLTSRGIPDSEFCGNGNSGWIEYKLTKGWSVGLRPEQIGFLLRRTRAGGRTFVAVRQLRASEDVLWLFEGSAARELKEIGLKSTTGLLGSWQGGPSRWDWLAVAAWLQK